MFSIKTKGSKEFSWHICTQFPLSKIDYDIITHIVIDGDELEFVKKMFPTLPYPQNPVVCFVGETAQFICANIDLIQ